MGGGGVQRQSDGGFAHIRLLVQPPAEQGAAGLLHLHQPVGQYLLLVRVPAQRP